MLGLFFVENLTEAHGGYWRKMQEDREMLEDQKLEEDLETLESEGRC